MVTNTCILFFPCAWKFSCENTINQFIVAILKFHLLFQYFLSLILDSFNDHYLFIRLCYLFFNFLWYCSCTVLCILRLFRTQRYIKILSSIFLAKIQHYYQSWAYRFLHLLRNPFTAINLLNRLRYLFGHGSRNVKYCDIYHYKFF